MTSERAALLRLTLQEGLGLLRSLGPLKVFTGPRAFDTQWRWENAEWVLKHWPRLKVLGHLILATDAKELLSDKINFFKKKGKHILLCQPKHSKINTTVKKCGDTMLWRSGRVCSGNDISTRSWASFVATVFSFSPMVLSPSLILTPIFLALSCP